jgi:hypothetical protein
MCIFAHIRLYLLCGDDVKIYTCWCLIFTFAGPYFYGMAYLNGITFIGSLGNVSAYTQRGSDKIILRRKGGPSPAMVKNDARFDVQRRYGQELGGCSVLGKAIRTMFGPHRALADHNLCPMLNQYLLQVQRRDTSNELGQRAVRLSQIPALLAGFSLNKKKSLFDSTIRSAITATIDRATFSARLHVPELMPGINFHPDATQPVYSITAVLGIVPDAVFDADREGYITPPWFDTTYAPVMMSTAWYPTSVGLEATTLDVSVPQRPPENDFSVMLSVGVRYGMFLGDGTVLQSRRVGAAKVLAMG